MNDGRSEQTGAEFLAQASALFLDSANLIRHCVGQLDDAQVWHRSRPDMNSIGNLLVHLAGNLRQRFETDLQGKPDVRDREAEFTERRAIPRDELLDRFDEAVSRVGAALATLPPGSLTETRTATTLKGPIERSALGVVLQALTHFAGHAQEIASMTRDQLGGRYVFRNPGGVPAALKSKSGSASHG